MRAEPVTWHHGLVARWWAEVNVPEPAELAWYEAFARAAAGPVLDLGCGAGRLLVPLLRAGLDVDGVDASADMLARAAEALRAAGLDPAGRLHRASFDALDLPRRYAAVCCCDSFGIGADPARDRAALRRVAAHLRPGGVLALSIDLPGPPPAGEAPLPHAFPAVGMRRRLADGDELELAARLVARDPADGSETREIRARLWRDGALAAEEVHALRTIAYGTDELAAMLLDAGFAAPEVQGRYTGRPAQPGDPTVVVVARLR